jgi:hypothetical protein
MSYFIKYPQIFTDFVIFNKYSYPKTFNKYFKRLLSHPGDFTSHHSIIYNPSN